MRRIGVSLAAAMLVLAAASTGQAATPRASGDYLVRGTCPSQPRAYSGTVRIEPPRRGEPFTTLTWSVQGDTLTGQALDEDGVLAVHYESAPGDAGLMVMRRDPAGGYAGTWAYFGFPEKCTETWTPQ